MMRAFSRLQMILVLACDRAVPQNYIGIDKHGGPVVHYQFTDQVVRSLVAATRASARIFFSAGAMRVHAPSARPHVIESTEAGGLEKRIREEYFVEGTTSLSAAHLMGGCAMGKDRSDSVTDAYGRVHGVPWLRVADSALFPDALQINPYLTVISLADRVAGTVAQELGELSPLPATA